MMPRFRRIRYLLPILVVGLGLAVTELGLRWERRGRLQRDPFWRGSLALHVRSEDPVLIYELRPGATARREHEILYAVNADGFRDDPFPAEPDEGRRGILVLGDSVAWGWGVPMESAFPQILERRLGEVAGDPARAPIVYNLAVDGYSTAQEIRLLESRGLRYRSDLAIVCYVLNDPDVFDGGLARHYQAPPSELWRRARVLAERIEGRMDNALRADRAGEDYHFFIHRLYAEQTRRQFERLGELSRRHDLPIVILLLPVFHYEVGGPYAWGELHRRLERLAAVNGLLFLDLYEKFRADGSSEAHAFDIWHPNPRGHALIADAALEFIVRRADLRSGWSRNVVPAGPSSSPGGREPRR